MTVRFDKPVLPREHHGLPRVSLFVFAVGGEAIGPPFLCRRAARRAPCRSPARCRNPRGPDVVSMPGTVPRCGWPCKRVPICRNVFSSSTGKYPACAKAAYCTGQIWPFESTSRSRSGQSGCFGSCRRIWKYIAAKISAMSSGPAIWPEPACDTISITSCPQAVRHKLKMF